MELWVSDHGKAKLLYTSISNEPIYIIVLTNTFPYKFKIQKIDKFKGKGDPGEHLKQFKYSFYIINNDDVLMLRNFPIILMGQPLYLYNNLLQHMIYSFEKLADKFLDHFVINIHKRASIMNLGKLSQFDDESISNYICRWRAIVTDMPYTLPQDELVKFFSISYNKHISSIPRIQQHCTFEEDLSHANKIEEVKVQDDEIKLRKKENNNTKYHKNGNNPITSHQKPQSNQVSHYVPQT